MCFAILTDRVKLMDLYRGEGNYTANRTLKLGYNLVEAMWQASNPQNVIFIILFR